MDPGADVPGRITRLPGGVAMNVAMTMRRFGLTPGLLASVGDDHAGEELLAACADMGIDIRHVHRNAGFPTDRYLAIEDANGLVAAVADARSLEAAGEAILDPLIDGRLATSREPWRGFVALDGNLTENLLAQIALSPIFAEADLRVAPASPGKVARLAPLLPHPMMTLYVNLGEAGILCGESFSDSATAARGLLSLGARRVLVTDGPRACSDGRTGEDVITDHPPQVAVGRCTGAGDTFMAAHIVAERSGKCRAAALSSALEAAAIYVSGDIGL